MTEACHLKGLKDNLINLAQYAIVNYHRFLFEKNRKILLRKIYIVTLSIEAVLEDQ